MSVHRTDYIKNKLTPNSDMDFSLTLERLISNESVKSEFSRESNGPHQKMANSFFAEIKNKAMLHPQHMVNFPKEII